MLFMLCRNRVADFDKWKAVFDSHQPAQSETGLKLVSVWRDVADPNNVFFMFEVADIDRAKAFVNDPASAEAGEKAGVLDGEIHFVESKEGP